MPLRPSVPLRLPRALAALAAWRWFPHAALGAAALAVRVVWVLAVRRAGFAFNDALMYHTTAISVSRGQGYIPLTGGPTARWPPGYSTLLGLLYQVVGIRPTAGELVNAALGAATVVLLFVLVDGALGRRPAWIAGAILTVLPGPILWTDVLVAETLYTLMFVAAVWLVVISRPTVRWALALGAVIGVAALVRGEALTWVLLPVAGWWRLVDRRRALSLAAVVLATIAAALAPWTIRNAVVMDAFVPVATNASQTLWSGHHPGATGAQTYPPAGFEDQYPEGRPDNELAVSTALRDQAVEYMLTHPVRELQLIPLKLIHLHRGDSYALDWVNAPGFDESPPLSPLSVERIGVLADAGFYSVWCLTVLGVLTLGRRFWRTPTGRVIATSLGTMLVLYGFVYYGNYRYRLPYTPLMLIVVAGVVERLLRASGHSARRVNSE